MNTESDPLDEPKEEKGLVSQSNSIFDRLPHQIRQNDVINLFESIRYTDDTNGSVVTYSFLESLNKVGFLIPIRNINGHGKYYNHEMLIKIMRIALLYIEYQKEVGQIKQQYIRQRLRNPKPQAERAIALYHLNRILQLKEYSFLITIEEEGGTEGEITEQAESIDSDLLEQ